MDHKISVIITTSPIQSHPSTDVIDQTIKSLQLVIPEFENGTVKTFIICDGCKTTENKMFYKSGIVSIEKKNDYDKYIDQLIEKYPNFDVIKRDQHYGFAKNIEYCLERVVTPYVLIVQHDWIFVKSVDLDKLVKIMDEYDDVKYINFISSSTTNFLDRFHDFAKVKPDEFLNKYSDKYKIPIIPLPFWYDKPHLCQTNYYKKILSSKYYNYATKKQEPVKSFVEDTYGHIILNDIKANGIKAHKKYGTFLYYENPEEPVLLHIRGRNYRTDEQKKLLLVINLLQNI